MYGAFFVGGTVATGKSNEEVDDEVLVVDVMLGRVFVVEVDVASVNGGGLLSSVGVDSSVVSDSEESSVLVSSSSESVEDLSESSSVWSSSPSSSESDLSLSALESPSSSSLSAFT